MKEIEIEKFGTTWDRPLSMWVILKDKSSEGRLTMGFGTLEGGAIIMGLEKIPTPRPSTHDLLLSMMKELGGTLNRVLITEVREGVIYGELEVEVNGSVRRIDARPSDAIALAVSQQVPILVKEELLEEKVEQKTKLATLWPLPAN
jgi:uncharacterized protein